MLKLTLCIGLLVAATVAAHEYSPAPPAASAVTQPTVAARAVDTAVLHQQLQHAGVSVLQVRITNSRLQFVANDSARRGANRRDSSVLDVHRTNTLLLRRLDSALTRGDNGLHN